MPAESEARGGKSLRVLSIDGGGMRGIVPATFLERLEALSNQRIADLFDVAVGTSTGSILAIGLNVPAADGRPKYTATDFVNMYKNLGATIFHEDRRLLKVLDGVTRPTYDPAGYEKVLHDYFGDATMADLIVEVAAPSIELEDMYMHVFSRARARKGAGTNFLVREVIRAATAAPTYFPAATVSSIDESSSGTFVDAGVSTNNPGILAFAETAMVGESDSCIFVSLGTGLLTKPINAMKARNWGELEWLKVIFDLQGDAQASYTEVAIQEMLSGKAQSYYHRFQVDLHQLPFGMDDTRPDHIEALRQAARTYVDNNDEQIRALVKLLLD
jgi:uncharacterized protein